MRRNDFFKYLLFNGGANAAKRSELETRTLPYTFTSNSHTLRNYRIYGVSDGVGDLDSISNKYIIPVVINGSSVNISLDSPLSNGDYIDFREQKRFNSDDSSEVVSLPVIPISSGINMLDIETENQPSKVYVQGNISSFDVSSWENVQKLVRAGLHDKYFAVGDQLVCQKGNSDLTWDIIGFDHDIPTDSQYTHSMTLQLHDCLSSNMMVDSKEALYYVENGLAAGTYNFTIQSGYDTSYGGGKTYQFTLANDVPAKGQLVFGWAYNTQASAAKITSYASSTSTTVIEQVGVTEGSGGTSLGTTDGNSTNVNHIHRARYGSNNYKESAIRQFLNSSAVAGSVWTPQTKYDRPPSWNSNTAGFMNGLDSDFLAVLGASPKVVALNTVTDGGGSVTINNDKFFLLSRSEVYGGKENNINEGEPYPYYSNYSDLSAVGTGDDSNRIKYKRGTAQVWWLRSPYSAYGSLVRYVTASGNVSGYTNASNNSGVAPACNII